jgi:hypothetical protein
MAIKSSGPLGLDADIANEFGGGRPHSLSEYYRGGGLVPPAASANPGVPTSGQISISDFYGARNATIISYQLIGGGGHGGFGLFNGDLVGSGSRNGDGGASQFRILNGSIIATAPGGLGGLNAATYPSGTNGEATIFGAGGAGGSPNSSGSPAPSTSYGAGGGGAGGDVAGFRDPQGYAGIGGSASALVSGTFTGVFGDVLDITIGAGGVDNGGGGSFGGGAGAGGVLILTYGGVTRAFTSSEQFTIV